MHNQYISHSVPTKHNVKAGIKIASGLSSTFQAVKEQFSEKHAKLSLSWFKKPAFF